MNVLDLTHTFAPDMPVYPGAQPPDIRQLYTVEPDGWAERWIGLSSHHGTHIDAPAHMLAGAPALELLGVDRFVGRACVVDASAPGRAEIGVDVLKANGDAVAASEFVLFHTGWSALWGQKGYFEDFPILSPEAVDWLCRRGLKGVGFDTVSADPVGAPVFANHLAFFRAGLILIENLTGLAPLAGRSFLFSCLPLKMDGADGSPVRAVAMVE
jgi:arylformamidase